MKTYLLMLPVLFTNIFLFEQTKLDGPYKIVSGQYGPDQTSGDKHKQTTIIKIFRDGYWISAFFGDPAKPFDGSGGGTYITNGNQYIETLNFFSWDSTAAGKTYTFNYKVQGNNYMQEGVINSDKYKDFVIKEQYEKITSSVPVKDASLEGVWQLQKGEWGNEKSNEGKWVGVVRIKIYACPRFAWAQYNPATKQFIGAGGGTYQFDGKRLTENLDYTTYDMPLNKPYELDIVKIAGKKFMQSDNNGYKETWVRLK